MHLVISLFFYILLSLIIQLGDHLTEEYMFGYEYAKLKLDLLQT